MNNYKVDIAIKPIINNDKNFTFDVIEESGLGQNIHQYAKQYVIKKQQLIEDFVYKNLDTVTLETMKCKIENELLKRKLKEQKDE